MRLGRRATLLVAFSLFTSAAAAYAECARVLWEDVIQDTKSSTEPVRAYTAKPDCDRAVSDALAEIKSSPGRTVTRDPRYQEAFVTMGKSTIGYRYVCLPTPSTRAGRRGRKRISASPHRSGNVYRVVVAFRSLA